MDSIKEKSNTGITIIGICEKIAPRTPSTINSGTKATMVVSTPKVTGTATSTVPFSAAT